MNHLGHTFDLTKPWESVALATVPVGTRLKDNFGRLWRKAEAGLELTLGSENDKRRATTFTVYAVPSHS
jgi:hypothetical protein